ncbi:MAG: hypothetical protein ACP5HC_02060 [Caldisericum sp.]
MERLTEKLKELKEELLKLALKNQDEMEEEEAQFFASYLFEVSSEEEIYSDAYLEQWPSWLVNWLVYNWILLRKYRKLV